MRPLVIIPARGGSKGVPGKNIRILGGRPLIQHTVAAAQECFDNSIICVTTDAEEIREKAAINDLKIPFLRPAALATDEAGSYEVLLHAVQFFEEKGYSPDVVVLLQPTSPFRTAAHIREAMALYESNLDMVVSVKESKQNPYYNLFEETNEGWLQRSKMSGFTRRQDIPPVYEYNGALYIINVATLKQQPINVFQKVKKYLMDEFSSHDIDTELDWLIAEKIWEKQSEKL